MKFVRLAAAAAFVCAPVCAQYAMPAAPDVLLVGSFRTPLKYDEVLGRLSAYYDAQVGRMLAVAFPKLADDVHYDTWHDMWVYFAADGAGVKVTVKRPTDAATLLLAKGWILQLAGRTSGELPVTYQELPPLRSTTVDFYGSRRDAAEALGERAGLRLLDTWQHAGLLVSAASLTRVTLAPAGSHGMHTLTATAEAQATARDLATRITATVRPGIRAAYSEAAEIEQELRKQAEQMSGDVNASTASKIYLSQLEPKFIEEKLRGEPANQKRLGAASGWYAIRYRVDKPYAKVNIHWTELTEYNRADGKFRAERPVGSGSAVNVRPAAQASAQLTGRVKMEPLKAGAYRVAIEGESASGGKVTIDQRDYWFDGKVFEEL